MISDLPVSKTVASGIYLAGFVVALLQSYIVSPIKHSIKVTEAEKN
jgi:hypothetical protein